MRTLTALRGSVALAVAAVALVPLPAAAAPTPAAELVCGTESFGVTGFGRGQALHVVGSTVRFVPTRVELVDGPVVFEAPGHADAAAVTCTTTSPVSGRAFTFTGFFTPQGR